MTIERWDRERESKRQQEREREEWLRDKEYVEGGWRKE